MQEEENKNSWLRIMKMLEVKKWTLRLVILFYLLPDLTVWIFLTLCLSQIFRYLAKILQVISIFMVIFFLSPEIFGSLLIWSVVLTFCASLDLPLYTDVLRELRSDSELSNILFRDFQRTLWSDLQSLSEENENLRKIFEENGKKENFPRSHGEALLLTCYEKNVGLFTTDTRLIWEMNKVENVKLKDDAG